MPRYYGSARMSIHKSPYLSHDHGVSPANECLMAHYTPAMHTNRTYFLYSHWHSIFLLSDEHREVPISKDPDLGTLDWSSFHLQSGTYKPRLFPCFCFYKVSFIDERAYAWLYRPHCGFLQEMPCFHGGCSNCFSTQCSLAYTHTNYYFFSLRSFEEQYIHPFLSGGMRTLQHVRLTCEKGNLNPEFEDR